MSVLDRVGKQLGDPEVQGGLDRRLQARPGLRADHDFERAVQGQGAHSVDEPPLVEHRRAYSPDQIAQLGQ